MAPPSYTSAASQRPAHEPRNHLLSRAQPPSSLTHSGRPASIAPSISSVLSDATTIAVHQNAYRGFDSREAYLSALNEFVESKMYMDTGSHTLKGFYGEETMNDVIRNRPNAEFGWQKRRREKKETKARRMTVAAGMESVPEEGRSVDERTDRRIESAMSREDGGEQMQRIEASDLQKEGWMRRLSRVLSGARRATIT